MSSSQIDPRLYGHHNHHMGPHPGHQHAPAPPHHQQHPTYQGQHPQQFTPPPLARLPNIHQLQDLPRTHISQSYQPQQAQQQQQYYRMPPNQPPQYSSPINATPIAPHPPRPDMGPGINSDPRQGSYQEDIGSPGNGMNGDPNDPKRSRACEACRGLKVRCDQDPNNPEAPCKRCAKAKRNCVITAPSRKRQKKTDSRVAELEKKIDALTASLNAQKETSTVSETYGEDGAASPAGSGYSPTSNQRPSPEVMRRSSVAVPKKEMERKMSFAATATSSTSKTSDSLVAGVKRRRSEVRGDFTPPYPRPASDPNSIDGEATNPGINAALETQLEGIINRKMAARVFDRYVTDMAPHLPAIVFDPGTTAATVRSSKPILFLSILVAASKGLLDLDVQDQLAALQLDIFADGIIRNGTKSLEIVQAMLLATIWYRPPKRYDQMNFYQLTHIAAVMAIDIGLGKRLKNTWRTTMGPAFSDGRTPRSLLLTDTVEVRRTWLGCYFQCANTSMSLRRPNLIRWSNYMDECIDMLETSSDALHSDKLLCAHVKLQHINEDIGMSFSMDDPSATVTISDSKVQYSLRGFERNLGDWNKGVPKDVYNSDLQISAHVTGLYMHEVALHINHNVDDFRAPFTEESLKAASGQSDVLSPAHSSALTECLTSVHGIFNTFFSYDLNTVRALPIFYFVRVAYAVVVLVKMHFAVNAVNSEVGKIINKDDLQVEYHLNRLLDIFETISKEDAFRPANKFLNILLKLRDWFEKNKDNRPRQVNPREPPRWSLQYDSPTDMSQEPLPSQKKLDEKSQPNQRQESQQQQFVAQSSVQHNQRSRNNNTSSHPTPTLQSQHPQLQYPTAAASPLHFLSEVATTQSPHHQNIQPPHQQQQNHQQQQQQMQQMSQQQGPTAWYQMQAQQQQQQAQMQAQQEQHHQQQQQNGMNPPGMNPNGMDVNMGGMGMSMDYYGDAMNLTLGGGAESELTNLFMEDPLFGFGLGMGLDGMDPGSTMYGMGW